MKKIYLKFIGDLTFFFLLSLISVAAIVWVIQAVNFLDFVSEDGHSFGTYFKYTLLIFPKIIGKIFLFIFFLSLFIIILKYENNNELIIFWTHGITKKKLINLIVKYSIFCSLILFFLMVYLIPNSQDKARSYIRSSGLDLFPNLLKENTFNDTVKSLTIYIDKKKSGVFENIFLKTTQVTNDRSYNIIFAKRGLFKNYNGDNYLTLEDGHFLVKDGVSHTNFTFDKFDYNLSNFSTKTTTYTKVQELKTSYILNCISYVKKYPQSETYKTFVEFKDRNGAHRCVAKFLPEAYQELFERINVIFYLPLLGLIASILILTSKDQINYNKQKIIIICFSIFIIILKEFSSQYFFTNNITMTIFLIMPFLIFFSTYFYINQKLKFD